MKLGAYLNILAGILVLFAAAWRGNVQLNFFVLFPIGIFFLAMGLLYLWRLNKGK